MSMSIFQLSMLLFQRQRFCDILAKKIQMSQKFVAWEFAWGRILNKYAVISPDKQNNDRKVSDCLSLTCSILVLLTPLKQCIKPK